MGILGDRLRELRGDRSLYQVGKATGIDRSHIKQFEEGSSLPTPHKLEALSNYYDVSYEELKFLYFDEVYTDPKERALVIKWAARQAK